MKQITVLFVLTLICATQLFSQDNSIKNYRGDPAHYADYDTPPKPTKQIVPSYPDSLKALGVEGLVYLELHVTEEGKVADVNVIKSSNPAFNDTAISAGKQWEFEPAKKGETAVAVWIVLPFKFRLSDGTH